MDILNVSVHPINRNQKSYWGSKAFKIVYSITKSPFSFEISQKTMSTPQKQPYDAFLRVDNNFT